MPREVRMIMSSILLALTAAPVANAQTAEDDATKIDEIVSVAPPRKPAQPNMGVNLPDFSLGTMPFDFPTGLRILMQADPGYPIVTIMSVVDHGSTSDPVGKEGIAHFVEHAWFRSEHGDLPPIMDVIQDLGCDFNATTREDWTDYRTVCSSQHLDAMIRMESLRLTDPVVGLTEEEVTTEREVIRNELRMRMENSGGVFGEARRYLNESLWPSDHPYARLTIGTHGSLDNVKRADIEQFTVDYYRPDTTTIMFIGEIPADRGEQFSLLLDNMDLSLLHPDLKDEHLFQYPKPEFADNPDRNNPDHWLTGAFDPATFKKGSADNQFFQFAEPREPRIDSAVPAPEPPPVGKEGVFTYEAALDNPTVVVSWSLPAGYRGLDTQWNVAGNVLSAAVTQEMGYGSMASDFREFDKNNSGCFYMAGRFGSTMSCIATFEKGYTPDGERVAEKLQDKFQALYDVGMRESWKYQFQQARNSFLAGAINQLDVVSSVMGGRTENTVVPAHLTGSVDAVSEQMRDAMQVQLNPIIAGVKKYVTRERASIVVLTPLPEDDIVTDNSESSYAGATRGDDVGALQDDLSGYTLEQIAAEGISPNLDNLRQATLQNGMTVVVMPQGEVPTANFRLILGGGSWSPQPGLAKMASTFATAEVDDALQFAGFWSEVFTQSRTTTAFGLSAPTGNIDSALFSMRKAVDTLVPELTGRVYWLQKQERAVKRQWKRESYWRGQVQGEVMGTPEWASGTTWEDVQAMKEYSTADIRGYYNRVLQPQNATLVVTGGVDPMEVIQMANTYFGGWEASAGTEVGPYPQPEGLGTPGASKVLLFDNKGSTQTQVSYQCRMPNSDYDGQWANKVLGKMFSDKAFMKLRVEEGLTYGAYAFAQTVNDGRSYFGFQSLTPNVSTVRTIEVFEELMAAAENGDYSDNDVKQAKLRLVRKHGVADQSSGQLLNALMGPYNWGVPFTNILGEADMIANVSREQMNAAVAGCSNHSVVTLDGPKDTIGPMLEEAGIEYEVLEVKELGDARYLEKDPKGYKKMMKRRAKSEAKKAKEDAKKDAEKEEDDATDGDAPPSDDDASSDSSEG